jgi:hypothetical protein
MQRLARPFAARLVKPRNSTRFRENVKGRKRLNHSRRAGREGGRQQSCLSKFITFYLTSPAFQNNQPIFLFYIDIHPGEPHTPLAGVVDISYCTPSLASGCIHQMPPKLFFGQVFFVLAQQLLM